MKTWNTNESLIEINIRKNIFEVEKETWSKRTHKVSRASPSWMKRKRCVNDESSQRIMIRCVRTSTEQTVLILKEQTRKITLLCREGVGEREYTICHRIKVAGIRAYFDKWRWGIFPREPFHRAVLVSDNVTLVLKHVIIRRI